MRVLNINSGRYMRESVFDEKEECNMILIKVIEMGRNILYNNK